MNIGIRVLPLSYWALIHLSLSLLLFSLSFLYYISRYFLSIE